jgi:hypothetical protein
LISLVAISVSRTTLLHGTSESVNVHFDGVYSETPI